MSNEWREHLLEDCMESIIDYRGKTPRKVGRGIPLITAKIIKNGRILEPTEFIDPKDYDNWMTRGIPRAGAVVLTTEAPLGEVAQLDGRKVALAQRVITLSGKPGFLDNTFLKFLLQSEFVQSQLHSRSTGTTVLGVKQSELRKIVIRIPSIKTQTAIAHILGTLDDKIELNRKMNETLEAMARATFKSWFIDFDPVRAKMDGRWKKGQSLPGLPAELFDLLPSKFENKDQNNLPEGWQVVSLPEASDFQEGPGILAKDFHPSGTPLIRLEGLKSGVNLLTGCNFLDPARVEEKWNHFRLNEGDVLLSTSATLGRIAVVRGAAIGAIAYTGIIRFRSKPECVRQTFLKHYLESSIFQTQVEAIGVGSVLKHFGPTHLKSMKILVSPLEVQMLFERIVKPIDQSIYERLIENETLSKIRDTLLPKLISGERQIKDPDKFLEGVPL